MADDYNIFIAAGDIIVTGSDGLFDNLSDKIIIDILTGLCPENFEEKMAEICQVCVHCALDEDYLSPFALEARRYGYKGEKGGKLDDLTAIINLLSEWPTMH